MSGTELKKLRTAAGLTQQELGALANLRQASIANWENGRYIPARNSVRILENALGLNGELFNAFGYIDQLSDDAKAGATLRDLRKARGLTQQQLAQQLGTHAASVAIWEAGGHPRLETLIRLDAILDAGGTLIARFGPPPPYRKRTKRHDTRLDFIVNAYTAEGQTLQSIGDALGITRERVRQILASAGVDNTKRPPRAPTRRAPSSPTDTTPALDAHQTDIATPAKRSTMPDNTTAGAALKALREAHGLTQQQLADHLEMHYTSVSGWEHGRTRPTRRTVQLLETALGLNGQLLTAYAYAGVTPYDQLHADVADLTKRVDELTSTVDALRKAIDNAR